MLTKERLPAMGLRESSIRSREIVHNGGWYNTLGEKLGWGDLDESDFKNIQANLKDGEAFVVLEESDSFWSFVTEHGSIGGLCKTSPEERKPGQDYLIEHPYIVITNRDVFNYYDYKTDVTPEQLAEIIRNAV